MAKKTKKSTAELIGISNFSRNGLETYDGNELVYFIVQPTNISVLSETNISLKIQHLMQLLSLQPDLEIICSDARENFEHNKLSLARKAEKEDNLKVQLLAEFLYKRVLFNQYCILFALVACVALDNHLVYHYFHFHCGVAQERAHTLANALSFVFEQVGCHLVVY